MCAICSNTSCAGPETLPPRHSLQDYPDDKSWIPYYENINTAWQTWVMGGGSHLSASHNREHAKVWDTLWNPLPLEESNPASVKPYRPKLIHLESCNQGFDDPSPKRATPLECRCIPAPRTARLFSSTQDHRLDWISCGPVTLQICESIVVEVLRIQINQIGCYSTIQVGIIYINCLHI